MQPCVIDSCSLLHSFHLQVGGATLNELMAEHFEVVLHPTVLDEMRTALGRAYPQWKERGLVSEESSEIRRSHVAWTATRRSDLDISETKERLKREDLPSLDAGEIDCIALAHRTSDDKVSYVLFLTDDYDAGEVAKTVFDKYQCGIVMRSADLIIFFGLRFGLAKQEIHQGIRSLIAFYTSIYDSLLKEIKVLLPTNHSIYVYPLIHEGNFTRALEAVRRLTLDNPGKSRLTELLGEMASLSAEKSVLAHSVSRLRALQEIHT
jgi:hypothetical protein